MTFCFSVGIILVSLRLAVAPCSRAQESAGPSGVDQALLEAVRNGDAASVRQLLDRGAQIEAKDKNGETALVLAAKGGNTALVSLLLSRNPSVEDKNEALFAVGDSEPGVIEIPHSNGQDQVRSTQGTQTLTDTYNADIARLLLASGAEIDARDEDRGTPLVWAASFGANDVVRLLLDRGAAVDAKDNVGDTALIAAACDCAVIDMPDTLDSVKLLLAKGASLEARNNEGATALIRAAEFGRTHIMSFLLNQGADTEARDNHGNTALLGAAQGGGYPTADAVELLLDRKANIEAANDEGDTPLIGAVAARGYQETEIVKLLLNHRANTGAANIHGDTALRLAKKSGQAEVRQLLERAIGPSH